MSNPQEGNDSDNADDNSNDKSTTDDKGNYPANDDSRGNDNADEDGINDAMQMKRGLTMGMLTKQGPLIKQWTASEASAPRHTTSFKTRWPRDNGHLHATLEGTMLSQHSMKRHHTFGRARIDPVLCKLTQIYDWKVLVPKDTKGLTRAQKKKPCWKS